MIISLILLWIISQALIDKKHFDRNQYFNDHSDRLISRALVMIIIAMFSIKWGLISVFAFMGLFDIVLNKMRGLDLFYIGSTAQSDKFFAKHPLLFKIGEISSICIAITLYFIL